MHELSHALKNPAPQAPFSNIGNFQMIALEKLSDIFSNVTDYMKKIADPPQQQTVKKSAIVPHKVRPDRTNPLPSVKPNIIEDDEGVCSTSFQQSVHVYPSGQSITHPEVPVSPPRVQTTKPPRVDTEGPSSNLISRGKKTPIPIFALTA